MGSTPGGGTVAAFAKFPASGEVVYEGLKERLNARYRDRFRKPGIPIPGIDARNDAPGGEAILLEIYQHLTKCSARKSLCSPASAGMLGNAKELSVAIETCRTFFFVRVQGTLDENEDNDVDMDPAVLEPVSAAILGLAKAFDNAEMAHRKEHRLTDSKKTKAVALREYHDHLNVRRGLPNTVPETITILEVDIPRVGPFRSIICRLLSGHERNQPSGVERKYLEDTATAIQAEATQEDKVLRAQGCTVVMQPVTPVEGWNHNSQDYTG
ncbi:hypothetical protein FE257_000399 [Aspergillus nanangensis]|uniref:Uncharacterized protein n=1 Tax=Aspergillus nanangensis TaxID=2582783 RepID=A0AAD4GXK3_ASPNN|nr:hypothetical protein FE257_000399 [Aspergillus nanangensis]